MIIVQETRAFSYFHNLMSLIGLSLSLTNLILYYSSRLKYISQNILLILVYPNICSFLISSLKRDVKRGALRLTSRVRLDNLEVKPHGPKGIRC
jgi:hypothetical protein